jgi:hypothetical protein
MGRMFLLAGLVLAFGCGEALAQSNPPSPVCYNGKIVNTNGSKIRMDSGQVFQAYPGSNSKLSFWTPLDKVSICHIGGAAVEITNESKAGQSVKALRQT